METGEKRGNRKTPTPAGKRHTSGKDLRLTLLCWSLDRRSIHVPLGESFGLNRLPLLPHCLHSSTMRRRFCSRSVIEDFKYERMVGSEESFVDEDGCQRQV